MAIGTYIARPDLARRHGVGNTKTMVSPGIRAHVGPLGHVTRLARQGHVAVLVRDVDRHLFIRARVARETERIAGEPSLSRVRVVAVGTRYAGLRHTALQEGPVDIDLIQDVAVVVIQTIADQCRSVLIEE